MRYAIFSDIHNHSAALDAALQDAAGRAIDVYLCLGDVGIDSCVHLVRNVGAETVFGNWEVSGWRTLSPANQAWALQLPPMRTYDGFWISHAAPTWPKNISSLEKFLKARHQLGMSKQFPYYIGQSTALWDAFSELLTAQIPLLFHGHTHRQVVWELSPTNLLNKKPPADFSLAGGYAYVVGVGSVGQPRDLPGPAYVVFDTATDQVEFIRLRR